MSKFGFPRCLRAVVPVMVLGVGLAGCIGNSALDNLAYAKPTGTAFDTALYDNYAFLARSFGDVGAARHTVFDYEGSWSLNGTDKAIASLANAFAAKAVDAAQGTFVDPEPAVDPATHEMRDRLLRVLEPARDAFPRDGARVQADYDCWVLNAAVPAQAAAAAQCRASLDKLLPRVEAEVQDYVAKLEAQAKEEQARLEQARRQAPSDDVQMP